MGALLAAIQLLGPVVLRGAETGTLLEIADAAAHLLGLLRPILADPQTRESLDDLATTVGAVVSVRPAQPEDAVFARQGRPKPSGR